MDPVMMDRDQRTVIMRVCRDRCRAAAGRPAVHAAGPPPPPPPHVSAAAVSTVSTADSTAAAAAAPRTQRRHRLTWTCHRLGEVLTVCACLLWIARCPMATSAPSRRPPFMDQRPLWINPCGWMTSDSEEISQSTEHGIPLLSDQEVIGQIITQTKNALSSIESFKHSYVQETFNVAFDNHHQTWKEVRYSWLPPHDKVPKYLGVRTDKLHFEALQFDEFLRNSYQYLQIMAVALEQVAWDHRDQDSNFAERFVDVENRLRAVLCEIQMAMIERKVEPYPDVQRNIMEDDVRIPRSQTDRDLRDWIIFRDYMIVLEYVKEVFEYFREHPNRVPPS